MQTFSKLKYVELNYFLFICASTALFILFYSFTGAAEQPEEGAGFHPEEDRGSINFKIYYNMYYIELCCVYTYNDWRFGICSKDPGIMHVIWLSAKDL